MAIYTELAFRDYMLKQVRITLSEEQIEWLDQNAIQRSLFFRKYVNSEMDKDDRRR